MKIDFHVHTSYSDGLVNPKKVVSVAKKRGLSGIAITDHDTVEGALAVYESNGDTNFLVVIGSEVSTNKGHLLGLFLRENIRSREFSEAVQEIHSQGGIAVLAHPCKEPLFSTVRNIRKRQCDNSEIEMVDGIEVVNARNRVKENLAARELARRYNKLTIAGSDGHFVSEIGCVWTTVDVHSLSEEGLRNALLFKQARVQEALFRVSNIHLYVLSAMLTKLGRLTSFL